MGTDHDSARMTGAANRGIGLAHRKTTTRGYGSGGGGQRVAQSGPRPQTPPFVEGARQILQIRAEHHVATLRPYFAGRFARFAPAGTRTPGDPLRVAVVDDVEFAAAEQILLDELRDEQLSLAPKYIPRYVSDRISGVGTGPPGSIVRIPVGPGTKLTSTQRALVDPPLQRTTITAGGFYSRKRDTVFLRMSQVAIGAVAHEMCHAYAGLLWDELHVAMSLQTVTVDVRGRARKERLGDVSFDIDEGFTIMLANQVIDDAFPPSGRYSSRRGRNDAQGGYSTVRLTTPQNVVRAIDGGLGTDPGNNAALAYFGGMIVFSMDEERPLESTVRFGRAPMRRLGDIL